MPIPAGSGTSPAPSGPLFYDPVLSRVRLTATGLSDGVPVAVQRSTDQVRWSAVRGGTVYPSGGQIRVDDYEFAAGLLNYYRVMGPAVVETFDTPVTGGWGAFWTTSGGAGSDHNVAGGVGTQLLNTVSVLRNALRDVAVTDGTVQAEVTVPVIPTGAEITVWLPFRSSGTVTFTYYTARLAIDVTGAVTLSLWKRVAGTLSSLSPLPVVGSHVPGRPWRIVFDVQGSALRALAYQTTGEEPGWQVSASDTEITAGTQAGVLSRLETGNTNGSVTVSVDNFALTSPPVSMFTGSLTPAPETVWLKSLARPFLNRPVTVRDFSEVTRPNRGGVFEVVGRSYPVAVTDVRGSRRWTLQVSTDNPQDANNLDLLLAGGDILLVHVPQAAGRISAVPGGYVTVGDTREVTPPTFDLQMRVFELPCVEVAAPGPDVVGAAVTCQTVLNAYATCQAVLDAQPTCLSLLELVGDPTDVIVS